MSDVVVVVVVVVLDGARDALCNGMARRVDIREITTEPILV